jgi:hypothetical protein
MVKNKRFPVLRWCHIDLGARGLGAIRGPLCTTIDPLLFLDDILSGNTYMSNRKQFNIRRLECYLQTSQPI